MPPLVWLCVPAFVRRSREPYGRPDSGVTRSILIRRWARPPFSRQGLGARHALMEAELSDHAAAEINPQIVHSPDVPSVRDENQSDTGITNDERGTGGGPWRLTSPCTPATTWPTSPAASTAAAAPGPCRTTPRPGNRRG